MNLFLLIAKGMDHDVPDPKPYIEIAEYLGEQEVTPLEIIEKLQETGFSIETHIGNEHMNLLLGRICEQLGLLNLECSFYINAMDTHLRVADSQVRKLSDIKHLIDAKKRH